MPDRLTHGAGASCKAPSLLTGEAALAWAGCEANFTAWRELYNACSWATSFQAPDFWRVWFRNYGATWRPALVLGFDDQGVLCGLMPLAVADGVVTGAGAHQAEYHGWLGRDDCPADFFKDAVTLVLKSFPNHALRLHVLPPGAPQGAIDALTRGDTRAIATTQERPVMVLDEEAINDTLKKKSNRSKINRLKRLGAYGVRRIEADEFERRVEEIGAMCDFRQGAVNDSCPFTDDALKRPFHMDWLRAMPRDVHVSGMFVGDELISVLILALSKREAHIAITAHSPTHAAHSPGKLHIYEAALALIGEGYAVLDLTPGGDEWKERFATARDSVVDLTVFATVRQALQVRLRRALSTMLRPALSRLRGVIPAKSPVVPSPSGEMLAYSLALANTTADHLGVHVNALADLLRYGPRVTGRGRQEFLSDALARMEAGERCYSLAEGGGIAGLGWLKLGEGYAQLTDFAIGESADARRAYAGIALRMLADLKGEATEIRIAASDSRLRSALESLGLQRSAAR